MNKRDLVLHVGAHRTGSTSLQWRLDSNAEALRAQSVAVLTPPRKDRRDNPTLRDSVRALRDVKGRFPGFWYRRTLNRARSTLEREIGKAQGGTTTRRLILSDEMMPGVAFSKEGEGLYPEAERHLNLLTRILPDTPSEIHLVIRSYESFIPSVFAMRALYVGGMPPFDALRNTLTRPERGWVELVDLLAEVFPSARLVISRLDTVSQEKVFLRLTDAKAETLDLDTPSHLNAAPTVEAIEAASAMTPGSYSPDALVEEHAKGRRFDPLTEEERGRLRQRYETDCRRLSARPSIRWYG